MVSVRYLTENKPINPEMDKGRISHQVSESILIRERSWNISMESQSRPLIGMAVVTFAVTSIERDFVPHFLISKKEKETHKTSI